MRAVFRSEYLDETYTELDRTQLVRLRCSNCGVYRDNFDITGIAFMAGGTAGPFSFEIDEIELK